MAEVAAAILSSLLPLLIVLAVAALAIVVLVWLIRRARRSPRARRNAEALRDRAGNALVDLDDAVGELELEVGLSGALSGGGPASLRRARMTAQHVRDESFDDYRAAGAPDARPVEIRRMSLRIERRTADALKAVASARAEHAAWVAAHVPASAQIDAARERLVQLRTTMGDPSALTAELSGRFAHDEWSAAEQAARAATTGADEAERRLDAASAQAANESRDALGELAAAERALRQAEYDARILEETHRLVLQAAQAVPGEVAAARAALEQADGVRETLAPADAELLAGELRALDDELSDIETDAARHPSRTVDRIARLRARLDRALGDAYTAQQRVRAARTALPGTLAAARAAIAGAEASVAHVRAGIDARARLVSSQRELARARQAPDPVAALDAARSALRDADEARVLAERAGRPLPG